MSKTKRYQINIWSENVADVCLKIPVTQKVFRRTLKELSSQIEADHRKQENEIKQDDDDDDECVCWRVSDIEKETIEEEKCLTTNYYWNDLPFSISLIETVCKPGFVFRK